MKATLGRNWKPTLFGITLEKKTLLPQDIEFTLQNLQISGYQFDQFVNNHTFWPLLRLFMSKDKETRAYRHMKEANNDARYYRPVTNQLLSLVSELVRYCPICVHEDYDTIGETYIHRLHQIEHLDLCLQHKVKLITHCNECGEPFTIVGQYHLHQPRCTKCLKMILIKSADIKEDHFIYNLLLDVETLMNSKHELNAEIFLQKVLIRLGTKGYLHFKGTIYKGKLLEDFYCSCNKADFMRIGFDGYIFTTKFMTKFLDPTVVHPYSLFYLQLQRWLFGSAEELIDSTETYSYPLPFGSGPWICHNRICPEYNNKVITRCIRYIHEYISGAFTCPVCGMTYSRMSKPNQEENEHAYSIESFGDLWMKKLVELADSGLTKDEIAAELQTSDVSVRKYLMIISNQRENKNLKFSRYTEEVFEQRLQDRRSLLEKTLWSLGDKTSRPDIRNEMGEHYYDWLMKHDRQWLETKLPPRKPNLSKYCDYDAIDMEMLRKLRKAKSDLLAENITCRITKSRIIAELTSLDQGRMKNPASVSKLTRCQALLEELVETEDDFQKRMFTVALNRFQTSRYNRLTYGLLKNFHATYKHCSEEIEKWLNEQLANLSVNKS
ncbi:TnsD family transposase [Paenibacillus tyrfis]|uniref:TnsD family transposase n=1 Tax=Paenibacillus tyrfis TaxID=1501230 RepID=UPI00209CC44B|nr:TnsD family transposase [Paenibacillus tyrfis]MCP1311552.1 TnsD family transposase [Paenibacillus tyrfis]